MSASNTDQLNTLIDGILYALVVLIVIIVIAIPSCIFREYILQFFHFKSPIAPDTMIHDHDKQTHEELNIDIHVDDPIAISDTIF